MLNYILANCNPSLLDNHVNEVQKILLKANVLIADIKDLKTLSLSLLYIENISDVYVILNIVYSKTTHCIGLNYAHVCMSIHHENIPI